jgi:hypothetical protein
MLELLVLTEKLVGNRLRKLKVGKAPVYRYGIVPKVLVECADVLCKPLHVDYLQIVIANRKGSSRLEES